MMKLALHQSLEFAGLLAPSDYDSSTIFAMCLIGIQSRAHLWCEDVGDAWLWLKEKEA